MPFMRGCCCFEDLENGSRKTAYFTIVTGIINIIIDIWGLVHLHRLEENLEPHEKWALLPPGLLVFMYLEVGCNIGLILVSLCLLVGINRGIEGKRLIYSWVLGAICFRSYEVLLGIYCLAWIGSYRVSDVVFVVPEFIIITLYWCLNTIFLIAGIMCVISYWQDIMDYAYGKQKRAKYFNMLSNIRQAAKKKNFLSTAPSAYSYMARSAMSGSRQTLTTPGQPMAHSSTHHLEPSHHQRHALPSVTSVAQQSYYSNVPGAQQKASYA